MSGSGGVSIARGIRGENRFYNPPPMRRLQQEKQLQQEREKQLQQEKHLQPDKLKPDKQQARLPKVLTSSSSKNNKKRVESDECGSSDCSVSSRTSADSSNLDRFLEFTTPVVSAQYLPKASMKGWRTREPDCHPFFVLGELWESFKEWSAYGAGVPLVLNGSDSVVQYYVPYLSGIQLYLDPSRPGPRQRRPGEDSDAESSRETSSDGSSDHGIERGTNVQGTWSQQKVADANIQSFNRLALRNNFVGSSSDESDTCNPLGHLIFEYLEHDPPFGREPLADKISVLTSRFPELRTYRSCDLSPSSWISVAWYPIYRIPMGPTLQNLDACFLTFHSLSTPHQSTASEGLHSRSSSVRESNNTNLSLKLPLPTFGLAYYKFKISVWNATGVYECPKASSLLQAADNWLRRLQVDHPDYRFFISHNSEWK